MPGYSQLKKLSEDVLMLGNEPNLKAERGEKAIPVKIPTSIPDVDDSADFEDGMPSTSSVVNNTNNNESSNNASDVGALLNGISDDIDTSDIDFSAFDESSTTESAPPKENNTGVDGSGYGGFGMDAVEEPVEEENTPDLDAVLAEMTQKVQEETKPNTEPAKPEVQPNEYDISTLPGGGAGILPPNMTQQEFDAFKYEPPKFSGKPKTQTKDKSETTKKQDQASLFGGGGDSPTTERPKVAVPTEPIVYEEITDFEDFTSSGKTITSTAPKAHSMDNFTFPPEKPKTQTPKTPAPKKTEDFVLPSDEVLEKKANDKSLDDFELPQVDLDLPTDIASNTTPTPLEEKNPPSTNGAEDFDITNVPEDTSSTDTAPTDVNEEFSFEGNAIDLNADLPEDISEVPEDIRNSVPLNPENVPEISSDNGADINPTNNDTASSEISSTENTNDLDLGNIPEMSDFPSDTDSSTNSFDGMDFNIDENETSTPAENTNDLDLGDIPEMGDFDASSNNQENPITEDFTDAIGDMGNIDSSDFNDISDTDTKLKENSDASNDFNSDFEIEGFTEEGANPFGKDGKVKLPEPDFSGGLTGDGKPKNSLTDEEYKKFKKNLSEYPLNVRIAVEDMIAKNEFTDDVAFEVIEKVLKKVTARQLAGYLEKMLDISLPVPRDFERRSASEYAAYKASLQYQLKNKILPALLTGLAALALLFCIGYLSFQYIIKPVMAENLYKQGYALLENDEYPQSEQSFNKALAIKPKKKWFFKYAQGYRAHKQYDRAELMYKNILKRFNHDKQAGIEYVTMELEDLANYELCEELVKREILDYYINDPDGILLLGDVYLEWATEKDPSKFEDAYEQYSLLIQLYEQNDLYLSRMLRYNIRTDDLRDVLQLKDHFYSLKKKEKSLSGDDWIELSGYLMDKNFGELPPDQEYLRERIEDVRDMLNIAIQTSPTNPVAHYNISRYFVETSDHTRAREALKQTEKLFDTAPELKKKDVYKQINNYRLLGEEYVYEKEYILAQETFANGLELFERKQRSGVFDGNQNIGKMYADMGDIDYFISGDLDSAFRNYVSSTNNFNDNSSIRYRMGYIDYRKNDYDNALENFIKAQDQTDADFNLMLALGNTLSLKNNNYASQGYYERLLSHLDIEREKYGIELPQLQKEHVDMLETYMKAANNLGVSMHRLAEQTGSSSMNASAIVRFQDSIRYYDALTRNPETMVRLPGSNLAEQNVLYTTHPMSDYEPAIYTDLPRTLYGEKGITQ